MPRPTGNSDDLRGTEQAAEYLGLSLRKVYNLIAREELVPARPGRRLGFRRDDLDAFIEAHRIRPGDLSHLVPPQQRGYLTAGRSREPEKSGH